METKTQRLFELLDGRTHRLRLLTAELLESQKALVNLDLDGIHTHSGRQECLCHEVHMLDAELTGFVTRAGKQSVSLGTLAKELDPESRKQLESLIENHESVRREVARLSQVVTELLRISRQSTGVLLNLTTNAMGTYEPPKFRGVRSSYAFDGAERGSY